MGGLEEDVLGPLKFLRNSIILGSTGFLVLGIIAASLLARSISKPIVDLSQIIEDLKARTENAVNTMEEIKVIVASQSESVKLTNIKFEGINEAIERIRGLIHKISRSGEEMEKEKDLIIDIMQNLSAISQENAASTEEASASVEEQTAAMEEIANASEALASLADDMQVLVSKFKL